MNVLPIEHKHPPVVLMAARIEGQRHVVGVLDEAEELAVEVQDAFVVLEDFDVRRSRVLQALHSNFNAWVLLGGRKHAAHRDDQAGLHHSVNAQVFQRRRHRCDCLFLTDTTEEVWQAFLLRTGYMPAGTGFSVIPSSSCIKIGMCERVCRRIAARSATSSCAWGAQRASMLSKKRLMVSRMGMFDAEQKSFLIGN